MDALDTVHYYLWRRDKNEIHGVLLRVWSRRIQREDSFQIRRQLQLQYVLIYILITLVLLIIIFNLGQTRCKYGSDAMMNQNGWLVANFRDHQTNDNNTLFRY